MIEQYTKVAERAARSVTRTDNPLFEDAIQEGLIAIWKELDKGVKVSEALAYTIARRRCLNLIETGHTTGHERSVTFSGSTKVVSLEAIYESVIGGEEYSYTSPSVEPVNPEHVAVRQAVATLPEDTKAHVYARFWEDAAPARMSEITGLTEIGNRYAWRTRHQKRLFWALQGVAA